MDSANDLKDKISSQLFNINPEPIGLFTLPFEKHVRYKKEIELIFKEIPEQLHQKWRQEPFSEHICNASKQNIFKSFPQLIDLKKDIINFLLEYIKNIGFLSEEVIINSAWLNRSNKNATLRMHSHSNSYISGNYFVNFDIQKHSPLIFQNDRKKGTNYRQTMEVPKLPNKDTLYNIDGWSYPTKEGQILLWRSHLTHGYIHPNKSDERCTLSFNSIPKTLSTGAYTITVVDD